MRLWGLFAVAFASCYRAPQSNPTCSITCSGGSDTCPADLVCEGGFCVEPGQVCRPAFVSVAAGTGFACGIDTNGSLWCWGSNAHHQISQRDQLQFPLATRIDISRHWDVIDAGGEHICGITGGRLYCWGNNDRGQVSGSISGDVTTPLEIEGGPWTTVSAGMRSTCGIAGGTLSCWGANGNGQLGDGTQVDRGAPTPVSTSLVDWTRVSVGNTHACAISESAGAYCWGYNNAGQCGTIFATWQLTPQQVLDGASTIAVSAAASCATTADQQLYCWGTNGSGELGEAHFGQVGSSIPSPATATTGWTALAATERAFCGLRSGQVVCWGSTNNGGLGNGFWVQTAANRVFAPVTGTTGATQLAMGWSEDYDIAFDIDLEDLPLACAVVGSDALCWGDNRFGQLALGAATMAVTPTEIAGSHHFSDFSLGQAHGCGVENGAVLCWGSTEYGATTGVLAGNSTKACNPSLDCDLGSPKQLNFFSPTATKVACGALHSCAFHAGTITCWGDNSRSQLASNNPAPPRERDIVGPGAAPWTALLETGRYGQCGVYRSGATDATACWGVVLQPRTGVTPIAALNGVRALALGTTDALVDFDCIVDATGALQCQGDNTYGEYGDNTTTTVVTLAPVTPARTYTAIATNTQSPTQCGIRPDGHVECWGLNNRGQTGASVLGNTLAPHEIAGLAQCTAVSVGHQHACAICAGTVSCWGDNRFGQLGLGTLGDDPVLEPQQTLAGDTWVQLASGYNFTCARSEQGVVKCWGFDRHGGVGNGGRAANLPVTVGATPAQ